MQAQFLKSTLWKMLIYLWNSVLYKSSDFLRKVFPQVEKLTLFDSHYSLWAPDPLRRASYTPTELWPLWLLIRYNWQKRCFGLWDWCGNVKMQWGLERWLSEYEHLQACWPQFRSQHPHNNSDSLCIPVPQNQEGYRQITGTCWQDREPASKDKVENKALLWSSCVYLHTHTAHTHTTKRK